MKDIASTIEFVSVESSQINRIGYSEEHKVLAIEFIRNNALYYYFKVSKDIFDKMIKAESVGRFLGSEIKGKYDYKKIS